MTLCHLRQFWWTLKKSMFLESNSKTFVGSKYLGFEEHFYSSQSTTTLRRSVTLMTGSFAPCLFVYPHFLCTTFAASWLLVPSQRCGRVVIYIHKYIYIHIGRCTYVHIYVYLHFKIIFVIHSNPHWFSKKQHRCLMTITWISNEIVIDIQLNFSLFSTKMIFDFWLHDFGYPMNSIRYQSKVGGKTLSDLPQISIVAQTLPSPHIFIEFSLYTFSSISRTWPYQYTPSLCTVW